MAEGTIDGLLLGAVSPSQTLTFFSQEEAEGPEQEKMCERQTIDLKAEAAVTLTSCGVAPS